MAERQELPLKGEIREVGEQIDCLASEISSFFIARRYKDSKLTIFVRSTAVEDGSRDFLLTNDEIEEVIAALKMRKTQPSMVGTV